VELLLLLQAEDELSEKKYLQIVKKIPQSPGKIFKKSDLILGYQEFAGKFGLNEFDQSFVNKIRMKPTRTISGVVPVTVLTKPFPCPGQCIFCPSDVRMPKSYLRDEPGAQRAEKHRFDPYLQVYSRLSALEQIGHGTDKVELIILGGTWSFYPESYQIWYIKECFRAINDFGVKDDTQNIEDRYAYLDKLMEEADNHEFDGEKLEKNITR
jgi:elongator complex protein 3